MTLSLHLSKILYDICGENFFLAIAPLINKQLILVLHKCGMNYANTGISLYFK
ncbi:hypothetical protein [Fischerella thermalis]|uniref:hypothetical protein n=1 Tax=Fischerella thermalis TaxID=372787 RepID=UPI0015E1278E|nr:hypothetical protein [Fischerella thermalis]